MEGVHGRCTRSAFFHRRTRFRALCLTFCLILNVCRMKWRLPALCTCFPCPSPTDIPFFFMLRERQGQTLPKSGTNKLQNPDFRQVLTGLKHMSMLFDAATSTRKKEKCVLKRPEQRWEHARINW